MDRLNREMDLHMTPDQKKKWGEFQTPSPEGRMRAAAGKLEQLSVTPFDMRDSNILQSPAIDFGGFKSIKSPVTTKEAAHVLPEAAEQSTKGDGVPLAIELGQNRKLVGLSTIKESIEEHVIKDSEVRSGPESSESNIATRRNLTRTLSDMPENHIKTFEPSKYGTKGAARIDSDDFSEGLEKLNAYTFDSPKLKVIHSESKLEEQEETPHDPRFNLHKIDPRKISDSMTSPLLDFTDQ